MPPPLAGMSQTWYLCPPQQEGNKTIILVPLLELKPPSPQAAATEVQENRNEKAKKRGPGKKESGREEEEGLKRAFPIGRVMW